MLFNYKKFFKWIFNISDGLKNLKAQKEFLKNNPDFFLPVGTMIFSGKQGSGKTLTAVKYVKYLKSLYPNSIIVSNVEIKDLDVIEYKGIQSLTDINNDDRGVIYLIDEIHLEWNSLESKSIPIEVFTEISQQRKQRKHIIGTSQLFTRVAKPFREQVEKVVICKNFFGILQYNEVTDGESIKEDIDGSLKYRVLKRQLFFHSIEDYNSYDTFKKIKRYKNMNFKANELFEKFVVNNKEDKK